MAKEGIELLELKDGGSPWANLIGVLGGVACVIIAVALWQASLGLAIGFGAFGTLAGLYNAFRGVAYIVLAAGDHRARVIRAQGWAIAEQTRAKAELAASQRRTVRELEAGDGGYRLIGEGRSTDA